MEGRKSDLMIFFVAVVALDNLAVRLGANRVQFLVLNDCDGINDCIIGFSGTRRPVQNGIQGNIRPGCDRIIERILRYSCSCKLFWFIGSSK